MDPQFRAFDDQMSPQADPRESPSESHEENIGSPTSVESREAFASAEQSMEMEATSPEDSANIKIEKSNQLFDALAALGSTNLLQALASKKGKRKLSIARGDMRSLRQFQLQEMEGAYFRVVIDGDDGGILMKNVFERVEAAINLRNKYKNIAIPSPSTSRAKQTIRITSHHGIFHITDHPISLPSFDKFALDVEQLLLTVESSACQKACEHRLGIIQERSRMFFMLNTDIEDTSPTPYGRWGGSFADVIKVDNSIALTRLINAQQVLQFIIHQHEKYPNDVVMKSEKGSNMTLQDLFDLYRVKNPNDLTVEGLGWHARSTHGDDMQYAQRQNPLSGLSNKLLKIFLNFEGRMFPKLLQTVIGKIEAKNHYAQAKEFKIPIYGCSSDEIQVIAKFFKYNEIGPYEKVRWVFQLRLSDRVSPTESILHPYHNVHTLQDQLDNIFLPLFNATLRPNEPENLNLAWFMPQVGAFQLVVNREGMMPEFDAKTPPPSKVPLFNEDFAESAKVEPTGRAVNLWSHAASKLLGREEKSSLDITTRLGKNESQINDLYLDYYVWANLTVLNSLRQRRGMNTFSIRKSGGTIRNMMAAFLFADVTTRCSRMTLNPVFQYLFGFHRIGICLSPLSENSKDIPYAKNPLQKFLNQSLNVTLCTEHPTHIHASDDPLTEEYGTAQQLFRLSPLDMSELARNSVLMSSFSEKMKRDWLGEGDGVDGNLDKKSHVSNARLEYRKEVWIAEKEIFEEFRRLKTAASTAKEPHTSNQQSGRTIDTALSSVRDVEYFVVLDNRIRFPRTVICGPQQRDISTFVAAPRIARALELRKQYVFEGSKPWQTRSRNVEDAFQKKTGTFSEDEWTYEMKDSIFIAYLKTATQGHPKSLKTLEQFEKDMKELRGICDSPPVKDFAYRRLELLDYKFRLHLALNHSNEAGTTDAKASSNRDLFHSVKVDTHIHMAAGMTSRSLRDFILKKLSYNSDDIVMEKEVKKPDSEEKERQIYTMGLLMKESGIAKETLTAEQLAVHADHTLFERFDNFNNRYNPMENPDLRKLFLKTDNDMNGRYFADLINKTFEEYTADQFTYAENRISIYGSKISEWDALAHWFDTHGLASKHNKWVIQLPRCYAGFKKMGKIASFEEYLYNIFQPLWEVSLHPSKNPMLHNFLNHVSGFDSVDNEALLDLPFKAIPPAEWTKDINPPYNYYCYFLWANLRMLNEFRSFRGFDIFAFRPHCGESGSDEHLLGGFLCSDGVAHGINLRNDPSIQYLYYLAQIGLAVSPLSNNALFVYFLNNPFPEFFRRGLNVSLSTDDPLMFHQSSEPLIEEYSIASKVWGFSPNDMCEIARNSVLQSGFDVDWKRKSIGDRYFMSSSLGNDPNKTHLSDIRVAFRFETYHTEVSYLEAVFGKKIPRKMFTAQEEQEVIEQQLAKNPEKILLSTHDQAMEVAQRDLEVKKETLRKCRTDLENYQKQNRALFDHLSEIGQKLTREQQQYEEEAKRNRKKAPLGYDAHSDKELRKMELEDRERLEREIAKLFAWVPKEVSVPIGSRPHTGPASVKEGVQVQSSSVQTRRKRPLPKPPHGKQ